MYLYMYKYILYEREILKSRRRLKNKNEKTKILSVYPLERPTRC